MGDTLSFTMENKAHIFAWANFILLSGIAIGAILYDILQVIKWVFNV